MDINEIRILYNSLPNHKTKEIDKFNKRLIKEKIDVSFLKEYIQKEQEFHRTYFQVSLAYLKTYQEKFKFIEDNFYLLNDWWHVDQLTQFIGKDIPFNYAYKKAKDYVNHSHPFARRWGYVLFIPTLVKEKEGFNKIVSLLKNDEEYYVIMAEAWLISFLAVYNQEETYNYLNNCSLNYNIISKAISKICDSFRIDSDYKKRVKMIRNKIKNNDL